MCPFSFLACTEPFRGSSYKPFDMGQLASELDVDASMLAEAADMLRTGSLPDSLKDVRNALKPYNGAPTPDGYVLENMLVFKKYLSTLAIEAFSRAVLLAVVAKGRSIIIAHPIQKGPSYYILKPLHLGATRSDIRQQQQQQWSSAKWVAVPVGDGSHFETYMLDLSEGRTWYFLDSLSSGKLLDSNLDTMKSIHVATCAFVEKWGLPHVLSEAPALQRVEVPRQVSFNNACGYWTCVYLACMAFSHALPKCPSEEATAVIEQQLRIVVLAGVLQGTRKDIMVADADQAKGEYTSQVVASCL
jgi:hypothetical protein